MKIDKKRNIRYEKLRGYKVRICRKLKKREGKDYLELRVGRSYSLRRKVVIGFRDVCDGLGISEHDILEGLIVEFIREVKGKKDERLDRK